MESKRKFLEKVVSSGLDAGTVTTDDVIGHATPDVLAHSLPTGLKAKLISACLGAKVMDTKLIVDTLGTHALAEHMPLGVMWGCVADCAARALGHPDAKKPDNKSRTKDQGSSVKKDDANKDEAKSDSKKDEAKSDAKADVKADAKADAKSDAKADAKSDAKSAADSNKSDVKDVKDVKDLKGNGSASANPAPATSSSNSKASPPVAQPKPNVKARTGSNPLKKRSGPPAPPRSPTSPIIPKSDFDVDTDVGEEDWGVDEIVEVVEEEIVSVSDDTSLNDTTSLNDWKTEEETVNRDSELKRS